MIKIHERTMLVQRASSEVALMLLDYQRDHALTDVEMLQAVTSWQAGALKDMLRAERHPDDPGRPADEE